MTNKLKFLGILILSIAFLHSCKKDEDKSVESVALNETALQLGVDESFQLVATISPSDADNKAVNWASSDKTIATVDATGRVTGVKLGKATITVTTEDGNKTATCELTVIPKQDEVETVFVKGGTFMMGSPEGEQEAADEMPQHQVILNDFKIGKYEVTNAQYAKFLNAKGKHEENGNIWMDISIYGSKIELVGGKYKVKAGYENYPVIQVTWFGATAYAEWAGGRLPTEAEWEYAARGGNQSKGYRYSGSDNIDEVAWYYENSNEELHKVGTKKANELGAYDMTGNVAEWCSDWYNKDYYENSPTNNPQGASTGSERVSRGGHFGTLDAYCYVGFRRRYEPGIKSSDFGFRIVIEPSEER